MNTTTAPIHTATAPAAEAQHDGSRASRRAGARRGARLATLALGISTAFGSFAGVAHAESPPAPPPSPQIAIPAGPMIPNLPVDQPVYENTGYVSNFQATTGDVWGDLKFISNKASVIVQLSKTKPYLKDGKLTVGAVPPVYLAGTPVQANPVPVTGLYNYSLKPQGLTPNTKYYVLYTINGHVGQAPNQTTSSFTTKVRHVKVSVQTVHVSDDADPGINGGDIRFGVRIAPESGLGEEKAFSGWTSEMNIDSGETVDLSGKNVSQELTTQSGWAWVQLQGIDSDGVGFCPTGTPVTPIQDSAKCYDMAYAQGLAMLPTTKYSGVHKQVIDANVFPTAKLKFQAKILVETWYS